MKRRWWYLLLALPCFGTLYPPLYNRADPALFGLPFFYWYQLAWVPLTTLLIGTVVLATKEHERDV